MLFGRGQLLARFEGRCAVLLQEYYRGSGQGVELLMHAGRPLAAFQHRRLREVPVNGGASAFRESVPLDGELYRHSVRLLRKAGKKARGSGDPARWHKVRKRLKRVRYLITVFGTLYEPGTFDDTLRRMRKLQNRLGALQDSVAQPLLIAEAGAAAGGRAGLTAGAMCQVAHELAADAVDRCEDAWESFDRPRTWKRIERSLGD